MRCTNCGSPPEFRGTKLLTGKLTNRCYSCGDREQGTGNEFRMRKQEADARRARRQ